MADIKFVYYSIIINFIKTIGCRSDQFFDNSNNLDRSSRSLLFPASSTHGILIAIAMPLDLARQNVFFSYNFEANYNLPFQGKELIPGPLERLDLVDEDGRDFKCGLTNDTCSTEPPTTKKPKKRKHKKKKKKKPKSRSLIEQAESMFTRKLFYRALIDKLNINGFNGKACLLRLICEFNEHSMEFHNGVYGSIMHVLLSPSTSAKENIHSAYYQAEINGLQNDCTRYYKKCEQSILEMISKEYEIY